MIRYYGTSIVFQEVPEEITLAIEITSCPHRCPECHSPWLREDVGKELTFDECRRLVAENRGVSCVCFMGGDARHDEIVALAQEIKQKLNLKVAMYSGDDQIDPLLVDTLDYYKVGPYIKESGPLDSPTTNQRFYAIDGGRLVDITYRFQSNRLTDLLKGT